MKLTNIATQLLREDEDKITNALSLAMASSFKELGNEFKTNEKEIQQDVNSIDNVNESIGALAVLGIILAAPKLVEVLVKSISKLINVFKKIFTKNSAKTSEQQEKVAKQIIEFTHKWHKSYIKGLRWILKIAGVFKKAGITSESDQLKAAAAIYYIIIAGLAVYSGISAISAFKSAIATTNASHFSIGSLEAAMSAIKTKEVSDFLEKLLLV